MKITKFSLFERKNEEIKSEKLDIEEKETKEIEPTRIPKVEKEDEKEEDEKEKVDEKINELIKTFNDFLKINEDGDGGGTAYTTLGNSSGMGDVVAPQPSSIPGDVAGSTPGSGDLPAYDKKTKKPKNSKKSNKKKRHTGTDESKENMYITYFEDWLNKDYANKK